MNLELRRKLFHSLFGLVLILILFCFDRKILIIFLSLLLLFGSIMIVWRRRGNRIPIADWFEETFERKNVRFPGYGAFWYVVGTQHSFHSELPMLLNLSFSCYHRASYCA